MNIYSYNQELQLASSCTVGNLFSSQARKKASIHARNPQGRNITNCEPPLSVDSRVAQINLNFPSHFRPVGRGGSLASQPYFSLFPVGGARGREKYVWTLWPAFRATKECNNCCRSRMVCKSKHLSSYVLLFCEACAHAGKLSRQRAHSERSR